MAIHIIVDGYNLLRKQKQSAPSNLIPCSLKRMREELIEKLSQYKSVKGYPITIVFDGTKGSEEFESQEKLLGIKVIFSRSGETADDVIKRMVMEEREKVILVSSDRDLNDFSLRFGAVSISSIDFHRKLNEARQNSKALKSGELVVPKSGGKKKGPAKRLPKAERLIARKLKKL